MGVAQESSNSRWELSRLEQLLAGFSQVRLLVVGDVALDEYLRGDVERISSEAPVPVLHIQSESIALGGAGNVVRNIVALSGQCDFCTVVGDDEDGERVIGLLDELDVESADLVRIPGRPTTRKTRVVARSQQITRIDRETCEPIPPDAVESLIANIESRLVAADGPQVRGAFGHAHGHRRAPLPPGNHRPAPLWPLPGGLPPGHEYLPGPDRSGRTPVPG